MTPKVPHLKKISNAPKAELQTYGWTMPNYIILNLSLCCDIYLFCFKPQYQKASSSHHQSCVYQDSFRSEISFLRYRAETNKYLIFVLFLEVVTLTFVLQTSISIGFFLSPSGICVPSCIWIQHFVLFKFLFHF